MEIRFMPNQESYRRMTTEELRGAFALEHLFVPGSASMVYCDADRSIIGGVAPTSGSVKLLATRTEMAADYFAERREVGVVNIGGSGVATIDGTAFAMDRKDMLYIGRGAKEVSFTSRDQAAPALFYFVSFPAHASYPTALMKHEKADRTDLGSSEAANKRSIFKYIHGGGLKSCQLVMGLTELHAGSVWNTMPAHTHVRRMEVYLYFGLPADAVMVHLMGAPAQTRNVILRNEQGVISPAWSIHCGAATSAYAFIWAMGGENQEFSDMDPVSMQTLM
jgi:4-deoxy-L-threo-5-hexosulose-uronate ketol-isomerase